MDMFMEAKSLNVMMKMRKMSQNEAAKMLGVSQSYVANKLRLLQLDEGLREQIKAYNLSERHARALLRLKDSSERQKALNAICERAMSVSESEALIDFMRVDEMPKRIGRADRLSHIDKFIEASTESVRMLSSLGLNASQKVSYIGRKTAITIIIDEEK